MNSELTVLRSLLGRGSLTCDLSDVGNEVAVLPMAFGWRSNSAPFLGLAHTASAPLGDLETVYKGIRTAEPGCVLVVGTGGSTQAVWGETTARQALRRGVAGVVIDGACRDVPAVRSSGLAVVGRGVSPQRAPRTGQGEVGQALQLGGVTICPGDLIVSDENGTVVVPSAQVGRLLENIWRSYQEVADEHNG